MNRRSFLGVLAALPVIGRFVSGAERRIRGGARFGRVHGPLFADNAPYRYIPQPQIGDLHECDVPELLLIAGDRASGKSWAAAAQCCTYLTGIPESRVAVVGRTLEFSNRQMRPILHLMLGDQIQGQDSTCTVLNNGSVIHFFGEQTDFRSRVRIAWLDCCEDEQSAHRWRTAAHSLVVTSPMTWAPWNTKLILSRAKLRPWLATQPVAPVAEFAESHRRIVDGDVDRLENLYA